MIGLYHHPGRCIIFNRLGAERVVSENPTFVLSSDSRFFLPPAGGEHGKINPKIQFGFLRIVHCYITKIFT